MENRGFKSHDRLLAVEPHPFPGLLRSVVQRHGSPRAVFRGHLSLPITATLAAAGYVWVTLSVKRKTGSQLAKKIPIVM